jgi:hypothetical protein
VRGAVAVARLTDERQWNGKERRGGGGKGDKWIRFGCGKRTEKDEVRWESLS